ncbi:MAG: alkaline phosphatase family protein [Deltaproteobacteria bacterium]|nr:alkaline phosphatase family protein [Deltaproteobacteria bacterium]
MTITAVGDRAWMRMYDRYLAESYEDPPGVAMDFDMDPMNFRDTRKLLAQEPNFVVAQMTTADHVGHIYGIHSQQYADKIRQFDQQAHELLGELGPEWTVIMTGDHGQADTGTHGTAAAVQRRSPIYLYGPGIVDGVHIERRLSQPELSNTFAALYGVAPGAHSLGHTIVEWLDFSPAERGQMACAEARRAARYADAMLGERRYEPAADALCAARAPPKQAVADARKLVTEAGAEAVAAAGLGSTLLRWLMAASLVLLVVLAWVLYPRSGLVPYAWAAALCALALTLTFYVERFPGHWPNVVRVTLFILTNLITVVAIFFPGRLTRWLDDHPSVGPIVIPGLLLSTYTSNTQPMAYVSAAACAIYFLLAGQRGSDKRSVFGSGELLVGRIRAVGVVASLVILFFPGTRKEHFYGELTRSVPFMIGAAVVMLAWWSVARGRRLGWRPEERLAVACGLTAAIGALLCRRFASPDLGRALLAMLVIAALVFAVQRRRSLCLHFGLAGYAMLVHREIQMVAVVAALVVAEAVGDALARDRRDRPSGSTLLLLVLFVFGLFWVERAAIQGGIDIGHFAPAATFRDPSPPWWAVSVGVNLRWLIPHLLTIAVLLWPARPRYRTVVLGGLVLTFTTRVVLLFLMIGICGESYWTAMRTVGEIAFPLLAAAGIALTWLVVELWPRRTGASAAPGAGTRTAAA